MVNQLLECGADPNHKDREGMTPLLVAAYEGLEGVCELLLENDADIDHTDNSGRSALQVDAADLVIVMMMMMMAMVAATVMIVLVLNGG